MARTGLTDVASIPDPLYQFNFDLFLPTIPGGGDPRSLTLRCKSTQIPDLQLEPVVVEYHGVKLQYAGREIYTNTLDCTFIEGRDLSVRDAIQNWMYFARDIRKNSGNYKANYAVVGDLTLYDDKGSVARSVRMFNVWPTNLQPGQLDGGANSVVEITCTFSYDWTQDIA